MSRYNGSFFTFIVSFLLSRFFSRLHHSIVLALCQHVFCDPEIFCIQRSGRAHMLAWHGGAHPPRPRRRAPAGPWDPRSEEHTSELQSRENIVCRLLLEKKKHTYHAVLRY